VATPDSAVELGVAGHLGHPAVNSFTEGQLDFSANCDVDSGAPQYLAQRFGAFGAAYGAQLAVR